MGATQRIRIGDKVIESRELSWEVIKEIARELRKVARWNPEAKEWRIDWRLFKNIGEFLKFLNERLIFVDQKYTYEIMDAVDTALRSIPRIICDTDSDTISVCMIGENPYDVIRSVDPHVLPMRVVVRKIYVENLGELDVPYIAIRTASLQGVVRSGVLEKIPRSLSEVLLRVIRRGEEGKKVLISVSSGNRVIIRLPKDAPEKLLDELMELGRIKYYYETMDGINERVIETCKIYRGRRTTRVYLPAYTTAFLREILERNGYEIEEDYGIQDREVRGLDEKFELYEHQKEALDHWISNGMKGTIVIPTGGGKTLVGIAAIVKTGRPAIIFVPNLWLLEQWREKISVFTGYPKSAIGTLGRGEIDIRDITIATYQSGVRHIEKISSRFWLVIYDECHHIPARTFRKIAMNMLAPYRMALSATPKRRDKNEVLIFKLVGGIVYSITYQELVKRGLLAPLAFRRIYVSMPSDRILLYNRLLSEVDRAKDEVEKKKLINKLILLAQENPKKIEVIKQIVKHHGNEKVFVFSPSIKYAREIAKALADIAPVAALTAEETRSEEERIIKEFKRGKIRVLVIIRKAEEGVDVGEASVAIIAGGSKQEREFIQRVGRVLRPRKGKIAWVYEIVSKDTIEESMARKRRGVTMVRGISDFLRRKYGVEAFREILWGQRKDLL